MRVLFWVLLLAVLAVAGCASRTAPASPSAAPSRARGAAVSPTNQVLIVTPETVLVGRVALVDGNARCVVLSFPVGRMAAADQRLSLYRRGLKVGEVKVTGWQRENNIVADLVAGEAQVGDEARSE